MSQRNNRRRNYRGRIRRRSTTSIQRRLSHLELQRQKKYAEYQLSAISFSSDVPYFLTLNNPDQGTEDYERIGDFIRVVSIDLSYKISKNSSAANMVRIVLFHDYQNTITTLAQMFGGSPTFAPPEFDHRNQFKIKYDFQRFLDTYHASFNRRRTLRRMNLITRFSAGSTTILTGAIKLLLVSDTVDAANDALFDGIIRIVYYDS